MMYAVAFASLGTGFVLGVCAVMFFTYFALGLGR